MSENQDKQFLEFIVKSIVSVPDAVSIDRTVDERGVLFTLKVDQSDMGFVIGRRGQTAQAIRTLLKVVGAKNNSRINLKIYDPNEENRPERTEKKEDKEEVDTSAIDDLKI
jgi:uncharacterized protein